jgi:hypothetical protein
MEAPDTMPNYLAGQRWGTQGSALTTMQKPLEPAESKQHLVTFPEFDVHLYAAEPEIIKPICMAFDVRGRLWIAETIDYPNEMQPQGQGRDRIKICEDTNADGRADTFTIFADTLSIPTSFVFANGGIIVSQAPDMLFLKDTDADGRADVRQTLFTGWGISDTHAGPSNLRYGCDNWIWGVVGYSGFDGTVGGKYHKFGMGFFRFKADGSALEFIRSSNNNTWGLGFSEDGIVFGSTANNNPSMYMPIPNRYYEAVNGWSASRIDSIADSTRFYPITPKVRQVDWHDRYTAGAGHALYTARSFPKEYWNRVAFVAEPTGHLLGRFRLEPRGADFMAHNDRNFLASDDEWTAPTVAEVGPDGALWVIDWYNYIIQHNPTPIGKKLGKGNAYETTLRDKRHGRVYRVTAKQTQPPPMPQLQNASPRHLVAALQNDNMLWRLHAQRLLVERGQTDVVVPLIELVRNTHTDEIGLNAAACHALWTLSGLGALRQPDDPAVAAALAALKHPSASVRRAALTVLPRHATLVPKLLAAGALEDSDAQVRLAALLTVAELPASESAGKAIAAALRVASNAGDRWLRDAAACAAARNDTAFLLAALGSGGLPEDATRLISIVSGHYAHRAPVDTVFQVLSMVKTPPASLAPALLSGLASGWPAGKAPTLGTTEQTLLKDLFAALPADAKERLLALVQRWNRTDIFAAEFTAIAESLTQQVLGAASSVDQRVAAAQRLVAVNDRASTVTSILSQITPQTSPALARGLIGALTESRLPQTGQALLGRWTELTPAARRVAVNTLLRRPEWTRALVEKLEQGELRRADLATEQWQQVVTHPDWTLAERARKIASLATNPDRQKVLATLMPALEKPGDATRGRELFTTACAVCHTLQTQGGKVGPDLTGIETRPPQEILAEIVDPNRSVEANYRLWTAETNDGETLSGRLDSETLSAVEILDLTGKSHAVQRKDLKSLRASNVSLMPEGLLDAMSQDDVAALMAFLTQAPKH